MTFSNLILCVMFYLHGGYILCKEDRFISFECLTILNNLMNLKIKLYKCSWIKIEKHILMYTGR